MDVSGLLGILAGFLLGEGSRLIRAHCSRKKAVKAIMDELSLNMRMLPQRMDVLRQMKEWMQEKKILPGTGVLFSSKAYGEVFSQAFPRLKAVERDNLHVIYSYLSNTNEFMFAFEENVKRDLKEWPGEEEVWRVYSQWINEFMESLEKATELTKGLQEGKPTDVFTNGFKEMKAD